MSTPSLQVPRLSSEQEQQIQRALFSIPGVDQMSPYQIDRALTARGIPGGVPAGYKVDNGRLKYVALNPKGDFLQRHIPEIAAGAITAGTMLAPSAAAAGGAAVAGGGAAASDAALTGTAYGTGMATALPSITGATLGGGGVGLADAAIPTIAGTAYGTGMGTDPANVIGASAGGGGVLGSLAGDAANAGSGWVKKAIATASNAAPAIGALAAGAGQKSISPEAQALIDQQRARMEQANPLYENVLKLAFSRLPTTAQQGLSVPTYDQANASVPQVNDGNYAEDPATRNLLRTQLVRAKMSDPVMQAVLRLSQSRMPTQG